MKFLTIVYFLAGISSTYGIFCHICTGTEECKEDNIPVGNCSDIKEDAEENGDYHEEAHMCKIDWSGKNVKILSKSF